MPRTTQVRLLYDEESKTEWTPASAFELVERIHHFAKESSTLALWFRGQADEGWEIESSLKRFCRENGIKEPNEVQRQEVFLLRRFRLAAHGHFQRAVSRWEAIILAQHHGVPTRLIDWTKNCLAAIYFACESRSKDTESKNGALFTLARREIANKAWLGMYPDEANDRWLAAYRDDPLAVKGLKLVPPMVISERVFAQGSGFTIQEDPTKTVKELAEMSFLPNDLDFETCVKWTIPANLKQQFLWELNRMGMNRAALFPDLDGIAANLKCDLSMRLSGLSALGPFSKSLQLSSARIRD